VRNNESKIKPKFERQLLIFKQHHGVLHTSEALRLGIHAPTIYAMRAEGMIENLSRGIYRLAELPPLKNPDIITAALRIPTGVVCLISALDFHGITSQIPHLIHIAIARTTSPLKIDNPPIRFYRFSDKSFAAGIETHMIDQIPVRIYGMEKTIADCFKYRNKVGLEVAIEALKVYKSKKPININEIMRYAAICRVEKVIRPYLEALL
jgi:predicted transcriptional regulator of viral defense system